MRRYALENWNCWGLTVVLVLTSVASAFANPIDYPTTRDIFMRLEDTTGGPFHGFSAQNRVGKFQQDGYLGDFNRPQIRSDIEATLGHALTSAADLDGFRITWFIKAVENTNFNTNATYRPIVYQSQGQDWNEATANRAQADSGPAFWRDSGGNVNNEGDFFDGTRFPGNDAFEAWGTAAGEFRPWVLDSAVAYSLLTDPDAVGLTLQHQGGDNNGFAYSREAATGNQPFLQVTLLPEPSTVAIWSLLGLSLAGFGIYRVRRKK